MSAKNSINQPNRGAALPPSPEGRGFRAVNMMKNDPSEETIERLYTGLEARLIDAILLRSEGSADDEQVAEGPEAVPLVDEEDVFLILAREIHFSGSFEVMLNYYAEEDHKGVHSAIAFSRIEQLAQIEQSLGKNIAPLVLRGADAERVMRMRRIYREMAEAIAPYHDMAREEVPPHILLLEALLSEKPLEEVVDEYGQFFVGKASLFTTVLQSDALYDALAPGYGSAPILAVMMLRRLGAVEATDILFEQLYHSCHVDDEFGIDEEILLTLRSFGDPVKKKMVELLRRATSEKELEKALYVLCEFLPDEEISAAVVEMTAGGEQQRRLLISEIQRYILDFGHFEASTFPSCRDICLESPTRKGQSSDILDNGNYIQERGIENERTRESLSDG